MTMTECADDLIPIGVLSRLSGVTISTIRYYETVGLIEPVARSSGRRMYDGTAVVRLRLVAILKQADFSLDEVRELIHDDATSLDARRTLVSARLADVRRNIRRLKAIERALEETIDCGCATLEHCERMSAAGANRRGSGDPSLPRPPRSSTTSRPSGADHTHRTT
jgi:MerR family redox-sensitive transcriptional activator SoxR